MYVRTATKSQLVRIHDNSRSQIDLISQLVQVGSLVQFGESYSNYRKKFATDGVLLLYRNYSTKLQKAYEKQRYVYESILKITTGSSESYVSVLSD